jgi:hypothetical protein
LHFHGVFSNTSAKCSVKYLWGYKMFFDLILIIDLARGLSGIDLCFYCVS